MTDSTAAPRQGAKTRKRRAGGAAAAQPPLEGNATSPTDVETAPPTDTRLSFSRGLHDWLAARNCALAFSCYQSGHLFMIGRGTGGGIAINGQNFGRTMGLHARGNRLYVAALFQIWRLENALAANERANEVHDRLYVPRTAQTIGDVDLHEINVDRSGRLVFVNTKFSCLSVISPTRGFTPIWKPTFISKLASEDRCHLNGLALDKGVVRYVTAVSRSDVIAGWRNRRHEGGVLIDVADDRIVTDQLSMPHSPRVHDGKLWVLDSGRGYLVRVDPATGARENVAFCPGFMRGLQFVGHYAIVTLSLPRDGVFTGLQLADELKSRDADAWCGLMIIDLISGDTVEWVKVEGAISELFDVAIIDGAVSPISMSPDAPGLRTLFTFDAEFGALTPEKA